MIHRSHTARIRIAIMGAGILAVLLVAGSALAQPAGGAVQTVLHQPAPSGDIERGRELFMGNVHLQNGGPPCMGCHSIATNGILGGGAMGPDLTNVSARYTEPGLAAVLSNPGPVMKPIYAEHPLTADEQTDLLVFLRASAGQPEVNQEWLVIGISAAGLAGVIGFIAFIFRGRLHGVRRPMVAEARAKKS